MSEPTATSIATSAIGGSPSRFTPRVVAYLDILGFRRLVEGAENSASGFDRLAALRRLLDEHVLLNNLSLSASVPQSVHPRYLFISDTIILSAPLEHAGFDGLVVVAVKCVELAQKLLLAGHLVRGGINIGPVWHDDRNIFGTGYIGAADAEKTEEHPRIVLTDPAIEHWRNATHLGAKVSATALCREDGNDVIVDTLNPYLIPNATISGEIDRVLREYRTAIEAALTTLRPGSARSKWEWLAVAFNYALARASVGGQRFDSFPFPR